MDRPNRDTVETVRRVGEQPASTPVHSTTSNLAISHPPARAPAVMQVRGEPPAQDNSEVMVALMGATGTGKSTFINLLTNDDRIEIGHRSESKTFDIQTAAYTEQGRRVTLVDMPGFDDSRDGVTDTDILEKIARFLEPENGGRKLNGIIYMHRISDPRVGGIARKNIRMFEALCGRHGLRNVRVVTTNWSRVSEQEGKDREDSLKRGAFQALLEAGADMCPHANTVESAKQIMSKFATFPPVTMQIQEELRMGKPLADTSAGMVLTEEMREIQMKHEKELADVKNELEEAGKAHDDELRAELEQERQAIKEKMARANDDRKRLGRLLQPPNAKPVPEQKKPAELQEVEREVAKLQTGRDETARDVELLLEQIDIVKKQREELEVSGKNYETVIREVASQTHRGYREPPRSCDLGQMLCERPQEEYHETRQRGREGDSLHRMQEVRSKQLELEERLRKVTVGTQGRAEKRGGSYLGEMGSIVQGFAAKGGKYGGAVGTVVGGAVGVVMAPVALLETDRSKESRSR